MPILLYWIREREGIRTNKEEGFPKPWTRDAILASYRFCNVRRQDDKVTRWLARNWYPHYEHANFVGAITLARLFNEPSTLSTIGFPAYEWGDYKRTIKELRDKGARVFNPAYIVSTCGVSMDKIDYVFRVAQDANDIRPNHVERLEYYANRLMTVKGLGSGFLAAQIVADIKYTPLLSKLVASDWASWCLPGPGSKRGLNRLVNQAIASNWATHTFQTYVLELTNQINDATGLDLHAQDTQNCLCEFDKYLRAKEGGRPKQNYPGGR